MFRKILLMCFIVVGALYSQSLKIAAGAGYKKPMMDVIKEYEKNSSNKIEPFFGNMKQISTQAKQTNIALMVGDKNFLLKRSGLKFDDFYTLGLGKVVIAYGVNKKIDSIFDLKDLERISIAQPKKAIYGIAGIEFLKNSNFYKDVKEKLYVVATVPQAMTYVITNEVDAAIVNLTSALANKNKIGGYVEVPQKYYEKIEIVAGKLNSCNSSQCEDFVTFLNSKKAQEIFKKYGM